METKNKISILILSCDSYSDLWDDFFNLRDKYWPDCEYPWYVVTESSLYKRENVEVINCGKELNWAGRFRKAVRQIDSTYICVFLEDYFITKTINNNLIKELADFVYKRNVSFLNLSDAFKHIINLPKKQYYCEHEIIIPKDLKYGIDTAAAIWNKEFLLEKLGIGDYSAWQFEKDRCDDALATNAYEGKLLLCDDRMPLNISKIPVVIQGQFYPTAIKFFKKQGDQIISNRKVMSRCDVLKYRFKCKMSKIKFGRKYIKKFASNVLGYKFVTKD